MPEAPDARDIRSFLKELSEQKWLGRQRRDWPLHLYHFSDVRNVASILRSGRVYSRRRAEELGLHDVEIASLDIIEGSPWAHGLARLYFRPVTPTQYHNEGIRPPEHRSKHSHCPVPVFLIFDAAEMLTRGDAQITDGNLARQRYRIGSGAAFLRRLNFRAIYHDEPYPASMSRGERDEITRARCAEVVFPGEVDLSALREVVCRTPAERTTLLTLLGPENRQWAPRVRIQQPGERIFYRDWTFVRDVSLTDRGVRLSIQFGSGEHTVEANSRYPSGQRQSWRWEPVTVAGRKDLDLAVPPEVTRVFVELKIAGCLAYQGYLSRQSLY
ncbi:DarT ssDNA thymidine ADP-ribosyltransferase family protein [Longimicrobium sp.]|uniref:DarT ssDNA thymidine ADP-ribosyltransferase family protein n=1 Tax=Longimicrobium sp. TaxID=2029185 RepID=UPI002C3B2112|nr:DarT ssDNA thymidine ADP-ribosyltransferase family protein [Longimicrobium sp.]HSU12457.1 DarT ssDNA thymidine ADP-ribosyltransferase family protein [Longimicrobium sp.]